MSRILNPLRRVADVMARTFGRDLTLTYVTPGTYSTSTGTATESTSTVTIRGVIEEYDELEVGGLIEQGDLKVTVAALGLTEPRFDDRVTIASVEYHVRGVEHLNVGTNAALYELQVRR